MPDPKPEPEPEEPKDETKEPPALLNQELYNTLEECYVNYAGGTVENIPFEKKESPLPEDEQEIMQRLIVNNYGINDPSKHYNWVAKDALGPVFVYRNERDTVSQLYPAMNVNVDGTTFTVGTSKPAAETASHILTLGSNGSQVDFVDQEPYTKSNEELKEKVNAAVANMIAAIGGTGCSAVKTQVVYAETPILGNTYPSIVAKDTEKSYVLPLV